MFQTVGVPANVFDRAAEHSGATLHGTDRYLGEAHSRRNVIPWPGRATAGGGDPTHLPDGQCRLAPVRRGRVADREAWHVGEAVPDSAPQHRPPEDRLRRWCRSSLGVGAGAGQGVRTVQRRRGHCHAGRSLAGSSLGCGLLSDQRPRTIRRTASRGWPNATLERSPTRRRARPWSCAGRLWPSSPIRGPTRRPVSACVTTRGVRIRGVRPSRHGNPPTHAGGRGRLAAVRGSAKQGR